jgi:molecular chaperone DnaK (HSP70)
MSSDERPVPPKPRAHPRRALDLLVTLTCPDWEFTERVCASNTSQGGLFLASTHPATVGSRVEITVELPDGTRLVMHGTVRHVATPEQASATGRAAGMGVEIDRRHANELMLLEKLARAMQTVGVTSVVDDYPPEVEEDEELDVKVKLPAPPPSIARPAGKIAGIVGIDLGVSYSSIAVGIGDNVYLVPDAEGRVLLPSIVSFPSRGETLVGWPAQACLAADPSRAVPSAKRLLGRKHADPTLSGYLQSLAYRTLEGPDEMVLIQMDERRYAVPQVCSLIFAGLRGIAERWLQATVSQVVLSLPVTFGEAEKRALVRAAELGGLKVVGFVDEPVAGALAYGFGRRRSELIAVYDFGGGTFDFSLLELSANYTRVLASAGDSWLGGDDFDLAMAGAVADSFWRSTGVDLRKRVVEWQRVVLACERAKRTLTDHESVTIELPALIEAPRRLDLRQEVPRPAFEEMCEELIERSLAVCKQAFQRTGKRPQDVGQLVVTGGVSRIPAVRRALGRFFGREVVSTVNPDEAIALGAGLRAAQYASHEARSAVSSDVWMRR